MNHAEEAARLFMEGYNCAQSVFLAFRDLTGYDWKEAARLSSSFGAGMGRLREVCGGVSGMFLVAGLLYGYDSPTDLESKKEHYARIQELAAAFKAKRGSIVCRDILRNPSTDPAPSPRTAEYYAKRPCARVVYEAAAVLDAYIAEHPIPAGET